MATVKNDVLEPGLQLEEENGAVLSMKRNVLVTGLSNTNNDPRTLQEALDEAGVPAYNSSPTGFSNLILKRRIAKMISTDQCRVSLEYVSKTTTRSRRV